MIETPSGGRARIIKSGNTIEVQIPTRANWLIVGFLSFWMMGWVAGEGFAVYSLFNNDISLSDRGLLALLWFLPWTIAGLFVMTTILWSVVGQEVARAENGVMEISRQIFSFKRSKKYHINDIRHFTTNPGHDNNVWGAGYHISFLRSTKGGALKFDYGLKTLKFGGGIDEAEGRLIIESFRTNSNFEESNFG